jgi:hypothetical protein
MKTFGGDNLGITSHKNTFGYPLSLRLWRNTVHGSRTSPRTDSETPNFKGLTVRPQMRTADCDTVSLPRGELCPHASRFTLSPLRLALIRCLLPPAVLGPVLPQLRNRDAEGEYHDETQATANQ